MGLKDFIFAKDEDGNSTNQEPVVKPAQKSKTAPSFPTEFPKEATASGFEFQTNSTPTFVPTASTPVTSGNPSKEILDGIRNMYQNGFDSLNQAGYDFYEYSKAIEQAGGVDNPQMYVMAFTMAQAMDGSITKDRLVQSADFYIQKILEAHQNFASQGQTKLQGVESQKHNERSSLEGELQNLQEQLSALQIQINDRKTKLSQIDSKYVGLISETQGKLQANEAIKTEFVNKLTKMKNGITNNLK
jgi:hypothetical protein